MLESLLLSRSHHALLEKATATYELNVDQAGSYLSARGITREAATGHRLGFVDEPTTPEHERFVGWLSIPYLAASGVVGIKFRRFDDEHPKYDQPSQKAHLFNARVLASGNATVVVCEGELDAILCDGTLGIAAVGTPGTTWLDHWPRCFGDCDRVVVVADNDVRDDGSSPGIKHATKVQASLPGSTLVRPPAGLDMTEWYLRDGAEVVRDALGV